MLECVFVEFCMFIYEFGFGGLVRGCVYFFEGRGIGCVGVWVCLSVRVLSQPRASNRTHTSLPPTHSLKIWQKTKALKMRVMCRVDPDSMGGGARPPGVCTHQDSKASTSLALFHLVMYMYMYMYVFIN